MPPRFYRTEIAGVLRVGLEFDSDAELDEFLGSRGIVLLDATPSALPAMPAATDARRAAGRPSHDEAIAAAVDLMAEELDCLPKVAAQARRVREALEQGWEGDGELPALRTIEIFISAYRRPTNTRKLPRKSQRG